jgi:hypothetical protein
MLLPDAKPFTKVNFTRERRWLNVNDTASGADVIDAGVSTAVSLAKSKS